MAQDLYEGTAPWPDPACLEARLALTRLQHVGSIAPSNQVLYPALSAIGTVGLHFGKRVPAGSPVLTAALDKYAQCGVALGLSPADCYHPLCSRTVTPSAFKYPLPYFA